MSEAPLAGGGTLLSSRTALRDRWIDVSADRVRTSRGHVLDPFYALTYPDWVQVVAITPDDHLVLVRQYRHGACAVTLELPAGAMDPEDTDPVLAGMRELREETGFDADAPRLVASLHPNTATHRNRCHTVLAAGATLRHPTAHEDGEDITVERILVDRVLAGLADGVLAQAMHVSALLLALAAAGRLDLTRR